MKPKRILIIIEAIILVLILSFLISTGFKEITDVVLHDVSVSEDGTKLTFRTFNASSMGYIRGFEDNGGGVKPIILHYILLLVASIIRLEQKMNLNWTWMKVIRKYTSTVLAEDMNLFYRKMQILGNG